VLRDHASLHNYYGFLMAKATAEGLEALRPNERTFLFTRSSYAGIQRYASSWTGDNRSRWDHLRLALPMVMNMGLSGQIMTGPDLGGFWGSPSRELFIRFMQTGTLFPFHRNHTASGTRPQEIWRFDSETEKICADHIRLRYELLPYLYTTLRQGTVTGDPVCRPLCYEFPDDPGSMNSKTADSQYLCGAQLLVAPALHPRERKRDVYFPTHRPSDTALPVAWVDWWTQKLFRGGTHATVPAPLDRLPLFVKKGSVLPTLQQGTEVLSSTRAFFYQTMSLDVYPAAEVQGSLYLDDGTSLGYTDGNYSMFSITGIMEDNRLRLIMEREDGRLDPPFHTFKQMQVRMAGYGADRKPLRLLVNTQEMPKEYVKVEGGWTVARLPVDKLPLALTIEFTPDCTT
jgi:alpha-glucosidase